MKINGFKKINLKNPNHFKKIDVEDRISYHPSKNSKIEALVIEKKDITFSAAYRKINSQGEETINIDVGFLDSEEKRIKTMLYQELYQEDEATKGHYKYLDNKLNQAGIID